MEKARSRTVEWQANLTTGGEVVHVITGLEVGGAEMLLFELCRERCRRGRMPAVASLISEGPMLQRFGEIGVEVVGLDMRRGEFLVPGLIRLTRLIRRRRPKIVQGWLYQGNLGAMAATWLSGVFPRPKLALEHSRRGAGFRLLSSAAASSRQAQRTVVAIRRRDTLQWRRRPRGTRRIGFRSRLTQLFSNGIDLAKFRCEPGLAATRRVRLSECPKMRWW